MCERQHRCKFGVPRLINIPFPHCMFLSGEPFTHGAGQVGMEIGCLDRSGAYENACGMRMCMIRIRIQKFVSLLLTLISRDCPDFDWTDTPPRGPRDADLQLALCGGAKVGRESMDVRDLGGQVSRPTGSATCMLRLSAEPWPRSGPGTNTVGACPPSCLPVVSQIAQLAGGSVCVELAHGSCATVANVCAGRLVCYRRSSGCPRMHVGTLWLTMQPRLVCVSVVPKPGAHGEPTVRDREPG